MTSEIALIKTMIVEDHELTRQGLVFSLSHSGRFDIVAQADNGQKALQLANTQAPDVVLMDIGLPVMDGITATQQLKQQRADVKIIILTSHSEEDEVLASLAAGADAYCLKDIPVERLIQVILMVMEGGVWLDPPIAQMVLDALPQRNLAGEGVVAGLGMAMAQRKRYNTELTDRERDVLEQIVAGKSNKEIALALDISLHTVKAHVCNIIQKLSVDDRTQAAIKALKEGLV